MNIEDVEKAFWGDQREQPTRVRLARVIRALRDQFDFTSRGKNWSEGEVHDFFTEILGGLDAEGEAAGGSTSNASKAIEEGGALRVPGTSTPAAASAVCELCGEPMPAGEEMFKYHGYSGNCPKSPLPPRPQLLASTDTVGWLRSLKNSTDNEQHREIAQQAIEALEAMAGEVERLKARDEVWSELDKVNSAERDRLKAALERLGSVEAFTSSQGICPELYERITYARQALGDAS